MGPEVVGSNPTGPTTFVRPIANMPSDKAAAT